MTIWPKPMYCKKKMPPKASLFSLSSIFNGTYSTCFVMRITNSFILRKLLHILSGISYFFNTSVLASALPCQEAIATFGLIILQQHRNSSSAPSPLTTLLNSVLHCTKYKRTVNKEKCSRELSKHWTEQVTTNAQNPPLGLD